MTGQRYGKLVVLGYSRKDKNNSAVWKCACDCGNVAEVRGSSLRKNNSKSCGCYRAEKAIKTHRILHRIIDGVECKKCCVCKDWVSVHDFSKHSQKWDSLCSRCGRCSAIVRKEKPRNKEYFRNWTKNKNRTDIQYRIKGSVSARIRGALKNNWKAARTAELLGCSIKELKLHLESLFVEGMGWNNYGNWHVDHIKPCASFDLSDPEQQKKCFNYLNLQPLWAIDNMKKGARI